ncbi:MAG: hypothetical protein ABJM11_16655 [Marinobacter sp.]|uniref:hypothetical protein n=1 Tax=Marinobacter sp. TaxID=50741 RepID=UPI0032972AEB
MKKLLLCAIALLSITGCTNHHLTSPSKARDIKSAPEGPTETQQEFREVFNGNLDKVPLLYKSNQSFDPSYADPPESMAELLNDFDGRARQASGTLSMGKHGKPPGVIYQGEPKVDLDKGILIYDVIWDTETTTCFNTGRCLETADMVKNFVFDYTRKLTMSDLVCKNVFTWRYLAYGAKAIILHRDAQGEVFYGQRLDVDKCPRSEGDFGA